MYLKATLEEDLYTDLGTWNLSLSPLKGVWKNGTRPRKIRKTDGGSW